MIGEVVQRMVIMELGGGIAWRHMMLQNMGMEGTEAVMMKVGG